MKTKNFFKFMMVFIVPVLFSCNKDQNTEQPSKDQTAMTKADYAVMNRIVTFRQKLAYKKAHPLFKSTSTVSVDDARLDIETNFNTTYAFPDDPYLKTRTDSTILLLPVLDPELTTEEDMLMLYDQCYAEAVEVFQNCPYTEKNLLFISLKKGEMMNNTYELKLKVVMGEKQTMPYDWHLFENGEDWIYGFNLGKCDGTYIMESDAAKQLGYQINSHRPIYHPGPNYRVVYTLDPNNPYPLAGNEYKNSNAQYLMFYIESPVDFTDEQKCLDFTEMNFHFSGEMISIHDSMPITYNKPANWEFISCEIEGMLDYNYPSIGLQCIRHENSLTYAYRNVVWLGYIPNAVVLTD